jgi:hypothetical protein
MSGQLIAKNPLNNTYENVAGTSGALHVAQYVWDTNTLEWIKQTGGATAPSAQVEVTNFPATQAVSDGGGSLTVDGTVGISGSVPVTGTFWQATQPVSNAGTFAVQVTSAPTTTIQDGGGSITVDGTVGISGSVPVTGTFWQATQPVSGPLTNTELRASAVPITDGGAGKTLKSASFSLSASGTIVTAVPTKRIKVYAYKIICSAAISVAFRDGASTALEGNQPIVANGGVVEAINPPAFLFGSSAGNSLDFIISGTGTASGRVSYWDDDAS